MREVMWEVRRKVMREPRKDRSSRMPEALCHPLAGFLAALRFLTIMPLTWRSEEDGRYFGAALAWFPVIGLLIGLGAGVFVACLAPFFPSTVLAVAAIVLLAAVSGCLHLDGLADSGDGLLSARSRDRILEIMRDSRIGAMGVIALLAVFLGKYAALSSLEGFALIFTIIAMPLAGRCAIVLTMACLPYAREGEGLGRLFYTRNTWLNALWALFFMMAVLPLLSLGGWRESVIVLAVVLFTVLFFSLWCRTKIGGATGDTLGAVCELTEMMAAVAMTAMI